MEQFIQDTGEKSG
ncbi:hypothetical protein CK3_22060 [butyrate-producing bacterium SS3/4]|nr:hypothetical protein CK3_22060 [butyrate-producing bacterium SS3/4]